MFDLKAKLLAKGLVSKEQVEKITEQQKKAQVKPAVVNNGDDFLDRERAKALNTLKSLPKNEQYNTIRKWVELNRLDKIKELDAQAQKFFFETADAGLSSLSLSADVIDMLNTGKAGIIFYMSNHGASHAVVPRDIAEDVAQVFEAWVRVLNEQS